MRTGGIVLIVIGLIVGVIAGLDYLNILVFHPLSHTSAILAGVGVVLVGIGIITAILSGRSAAS